MVVNVKESALLMSESCLETRMQPDGMSFEMEKIGTPSSELAISHNMDVLFIVHINHVHLLLPRTLIFMEVSLQASLGFVWRALNAFMLVNEFSVL